MILNLAAFFIIPGYTLLFIRNFNLFSLNFSVIGNMLGRKRGFCLWGMMTGWYFFWVLSRVSAHLKLSQRRPVSGPHGAFSAVLRRHHALSAGRTAF